jgi:predicted GTPase
MALASWYELGFRNMIAISAKNNFNLVELKAFIEEIRFKNNIPLQEKENK